MNTNQNIDWKKYIFAFLITVAIFATAIYLSNYFNQKKIDEIHSIQDKISIDILSSETQFTLLEQSSCADAGGANALSQALGDLEDKLSYTEKDRGATDSQVLVLKQYYSLLEIKDYLLMQKISKECKKTPVSIIYFYSNKSNCTDCTREGYVLTSLRQTYPTLRVYSFDYDMDLSAVKTLISINKVKNNLPALFINGKAYYGYQSLEALNSLPPLVALAAFQNASSTTKTSSSSKQH